MNARTLPAVIGLATLGCLTPIGPAEPAALGPAAITVHSTREIAPVPRRLFGTGLRPNMESDAKIRAFLKETGITLFRYPDSLDKGYSWDWEGGGVLVRNGRRLISPMGRFDDVIELAREVGAELFFTVKIHDSSPEEAARWVGEAKRRGLGGGYWCFGNEPHFRSAPDYIPREDYIELVNRFAPAMKAADPDIRLGIAWGGPYIEEHADKGRDSDVLRGTRERVDFIDFHFYTGRFEGEAGRTHSESWLVLCSWASRYAWPGLCRRAREFGGWRPLQRLRLCQDLHG